MGEAAARGFTGRVSGSGRRHPTGRQGPFAKALYAEGLSHHDVAAIRSVWAVPGFVLVAVLSARSTATRAARRPSIPQLIAAAAAGVWCYYLGALANFYALTLIQANVERALLFSYPAIVVVLAALGARALPSASTTLALITTSAGVFLVTGAADARLSASQWQGVFWVMFCSITIATYFLASAARALNDLSRLHPDRHDRCGLRVLYSPRFAGRLVCL